MEQTIDTDGQDALEWLIHIGGVDIRQLDMSRPGAERLLEVFIEGKRELEEQEERLKNERAFAPPAPRRRLGFTGMVFIRARQNCTAGANEAERAEKTPSKQNARSW